MTPKPSALDRALAAIDAGLQRSTEPYIPVSPNCVRCHRRPAPDSDWCPDCRAYLLGDTDDDPLGPPSPPTVGTITIPWPPPCSTCGAVLDEATLRCAYCEGVAAADQGCGSLECEGLLRGCSD